VEWRGTRPGDLAFQSQGLSGRSPGNSFAVHVPVDGKRDGILGLFVANAGAKKPTRVFLKGKVFKFDAPTNFTRQTGLYVELASSDDILFTPPQ
jgi:hypothetical protein